MPGRDQGGVGRLDDGHAFEHGYVGDSGTKLVPVFKSQLRKVNFFLTYE